MTKTILNSIPLVMDDGRLIHQIVEVECKPLYYLKCKNPRHYCREDKASFVQKWVPNNLATPKEVPKEAKPSKVITPEACVETGARAPNTKSEAS